LPAPRLRLIEGGAGTPAGPRQALEMMLVGAALTAVCSFAAQLPSWRVELVALQLALFVGFALLAIALARMPRWRGLPYGATSVMVVALAMRLAVLGVTPTLSDDVYRYVWDGMVVAHGEDPYAHAPADPVLAPLRENAIHPFINHPDLRTIYPPVAQAGFALVARLSPTVRAMKLWIVLHDLALIAVLLWWLPRRGASPLAAIAYAWNPLVVCEYAGSGHHDPTALVWLVLALALAEKRPVFSALAWSAAVLVKLFPLLALPYLLRDWPWRARVVAFACAGAGLGVFATHALGPGSGLAAFATTWRNNDSLYGFAQAVFTPTYARLAVAAAVAVFAAGLWMRRTEAAAATRTLLRAALLAGPVAHPWYFGWPLALEPLSPSAPWLLLSCLSVLSYGLLATPVQGGAFHLGVGGRVFEYGVPAALAAWLAWLEWSARRREAAQGGDA
jgi:hypothetical protein